MRPFHNLRTYICEFVRTIWYSPLCPPPPPWRAAAPLRKQNETRSLTNSITPKNRFPPEVTLKTWRMMHRSFASWFIARSAVPLAVMNNGVGHVPVLFAHSMPKGLEVNLSACVPTWSYKRMISFNRCIYSFPPFGLSVFSFLHQ